MLLSQCGDSLSAIHGRGALVVVVDGRDSDDGDDDGNEGAAATRAGVGRVQMPRMAISYDDHR